MVTGDTGVHIWAVPGNVAGGFLSPSGNVTILCKYQPTPMFFALGFLHSVNTREIYSGLCCVFRPANGGKYCVGSRKRFRSCNTHVSIVQIRFESISFFSFLCCHC